MSLKEIDITSFKKYLELVQIEVYVPSITDDFSNVLFLGF